jgi:hypothetical protein
MEPRRKDTAEKLMYHSDLKKSARTRYKIRLDIGQQLDIVVSKVPFAYFLLKFLLIMKNQYIVINVPITLKPADMVATIRIARLHSGDMIEEGSKR